MINTLIIVINDLYLDIYLFLTSADGQIGC